VGSNPTLSAKHMTNTIDTFRHRGVELKVIFQESVQVVPGVVCDVYLHPETNERDLGIINIEPGKKTPPQKVSGGDQTIEGYVSGKGTLTIIHVDGTRSVFHVDATSEGFSQIIEVGEIMQWRSDDNEKLVAFEICYPPYAPGRYEDLPMEMEI
jgi:hypothetical protein